MKKVLMISAVMFTLVFLVLPGTLIRSATASTRTDQNALQQPTRTAVSISGRVLCSLEPGSRGHAGAVVTLMDTEGNTTTTRTNPFGYYRFTGVLVGDMYVVSVTDKRLHFEPQLIGLMEEVVGLDFVPLP